MTNKQNKSTLARLCILSKQSGHLADSSPPRCLRMHTKQNGPWPHFVNRGTLGGPRQIEHLHSSSSSSSSSASSSWPLLSPLRPSTLPALTFDPAAMRDSTVTFDSAAEDTPLFAVSSVMDLTFGCFSTAVADEMRFALPHPMCSTTGFRSNRTIFGLVFASASAATAAFADADSTAADSAPTAAAVDDDDDDGAEEAGSACGRPPHTTSKGYHGVRIAWTRKTIRDT